MDMSSSQTGTESSYAIITVIKRKKVVYPNALSLPARTFSTLMSLMYQMDPSLLSMPDVETST